jgi:MFS transporter, FSR family, fosmidomycin resistance protein
VPALAVALAIELADELADGAKGAALPLIRHGLGLSYAQVGLLASVPLLAGGLLELPLGILVSGPRRRRLAVLGGGIVFILSLAAVAGARSFAVLLCAFTVFFVASGAFVSLTQAELMDAWPGRQAAIMARWDLAGSAGAVAGPLLLTLVLADGGSWRACYLVLAAVAAVTWGASVLRDHGPLAPLHTPGEAPAGRQARPGTAGSPSLTARIRDVVAALRDGPTARWLWLTVVADLLVDVLTGFLALYLVDVAHLRPELAALAIAIRLGSALAGDAALVFVLERVSDLMALRASAVAAALLYPAFLLVPGAAGKLLILAALSAATAPWYPLLQARLYGSLPGRSSVAVTLSSAAGLVGGLGPLAVGIMAERAGLTWALGVLAVVPVVIGVLGPGSMLIGPRARTTGRSDE